MAGKHSWRIGPEYIDHNEKNGTNRVMRKDKCRNCKIYRVFIGHYVTGEIGKVPDYYETGESDIYTSDSPGCLSEKELTGID